MTKRDIVVVGGSAGSIEVVAELVRELPSDFPAAVLIAIHFPGSVVSALPQILTRAGVLPATHAHDAEPTRPGHIYVARPNYHLVLEDGRVRLTNGPRENGSRPAIDPLFRSAAHHYGSRVVGVILSGNLNDGTAGLVCIKRHGGVAVVQTPESALYPGMPRSAIEHVEVDYVAPPAGLAGVLTQLAGTPAPHGKVVAALSTDGFDADESLADRRRQPGTPSTMSCPECHGTLWEVNDGDLLRYRCRVGHAYTAETLVAHQSDQLEAALWTALRALEEHGALSRRLAGRAHGRGHFHSASTFTEQAMAAEHHASVIRDVLDTGERKSDAAEPAAHLGSG